MFSPRSSSARLLVSPVPQSSALLVSACVASRVVPISLLRLVFSLVDFGFVVWNAFCFAFCFWDFFFLRSLCYLPFGFSIFSVWNIGFIKAHCRFHLPVPVSAFWDPRYFASVTAGCEMMLAFFVVNTPYV